MKELTPYLRSSHYLNWEHPAVHSLALALGAGANSDEDLARRCFLFVRDEIQHSWDHQKNPVTCRASDVLEHKTGYCYAKSHLLAALLRANKIPAGLCYQKLTFQGDKAPYTLHGLNAVYLKRHGWYRIDARGNKTGVSADFCPPNEQLAFAISAPGEADLPEIWPEPLPIVTELLERSQNYLEVAENLPDVPLVSGNLLRSMS